MLGTKTVWVLGSGFSRSLGGPLLYELLGHKAKIETREVFGRVGDTTLVYDLFATQRDKLWAHAEQFLEYLDVAQLPDSPNRRILERQVKNVRRRRVGRQEPVSIEQLRELAILTVAAECSTYTHNVDTRTETWEPYRDWRNLLDANDTIVTFNYDMVLEKLMTHAGPFDHTSFMRPGHTVQRNATAATVIKLHGSVNWAIPDNAPSRIVDNLNDFVANGWKPLIATPGATKSNTCHQHLEALWLAALSALREAEAIVFIGYRFPPSDAEARRSLLKAIEQNTQPFLKIHTVLGPNVNEPDVVRLKGLLTHKLKAAGRTDAAELGRMSPAGLLPLMYSIVTQPLYAEDFLTVVHPGELFEPQTADLLKSNRGRYGRSP